MKKIVAYPAFAAALALELYLFAKSLIDQWERFLRAADLAGADPFCNVAFCDHTIYWLAGRMLHDGQAAAIYDFPRYTQLAATLLPFQAGSFLPYFYPPTFLPVSWLAGALPLVSGYYLFCAAMVAGSVWLLRRAGVGWGALAVGLASPMAMWELYLGQVGLLCGALLFFGTVETRPVGRGVALGLLCIKPQFACLAPVILCAGRHWRSLAAAALCVAVLAGLATLLAHPAIWQLYAGPGRGEIADFMTHPFGKTAELGSFSIYWMMRSLHAPIFVAVAGQVLLACITILLCAALWSRDVSNGFARARLTVLLTFLVTPYGYVDDLAIYAVLLATMLHRGAPWRNAALAWLLVAPAYLPHFVLIFGVTPAPFFILAAIAFAWFDVPAGDRPTMRLIAAFFARETGPVRQAN